MSTGYLDYFSDKFHLLSSKMWGDSLQPRSTSFLMSGNKNFQQYDLAPLLTEVKDRSDYQFTINPNYQSSPLVRFAAGIFGGHRQLQGLDKLNYLMNYNTEKGFSPSLFNFVSDCYRPKYMLSDLALFSSGCNFQTPVMADVLNESQMMSQKTDTIDKKQVPNPEITKVSLNISNLSPKKKSESAKESCDVSRTLRLNIELAHRKTKEMSKRSKKRRRRLKKSEQLIVSNSASDDEDDTNRERSCHTADSVCFLSKSPDFSCTLSVQLSPCNSFLVPVTSDSEDDSEWETIDEIEISATSDANASAADCNSSSTSSSSPIQCKSLKPNCFKSVDCSVQISSLISFVIPENDSNDDDSDWDTCDSDTFPENTGLKLSGLYFTDLCTPQSYYKNECDYDSASEEECEEILQLRAILLEANNKWNKLDEDSQKPKSASKVTFASDEDLVEVFPVEAFERKGEWEIYATERIRFKRKINELEKVISPCLKPEHRSKIFKKLVEPEL